MTIVSGTISSATASDAFNFLHDGIVSAQGMAGNTCDIELSIDAGVTWQVVKTITADTVEIINLPRLLDYQVRLNCTTYAAPITYTMWGA